MFSFDAMVDSLVPADRGKKQGGWTFERTNSRRCGEAKL